MRNADGQKDPLIKLIRELQTQEGRISNSLFFAEGDELSRRAFEYGGNVRTLLLTEKYADSSSGKELLETAFERNTECVVCTSGLLGKILDAKPVPECLVVVERIDIGLRQALEYNKFILMIEACENSDNLGMLLRCADAAGVDSVVLAGDCVEPFNRKTVRGSRGAVFTVPISIEKDTAEVIKQAHNLGLRVIGSSANCDLLYYDVDLSKPIVMVVGNEHTGISETVRNEADSIVRIPMGGHINSLNIATAASALLYECIRQKRNI